MCGIVDNPFSVLCAVNVVIGPSPGRCRYCHQVGHMTRDCARAWDPPPSVPVDADVDVASVSDYATVIEDDCDPELVDKPSDPEPPVKCVPDKLPVAVPVEFVPGKPPVDVSMTNTTKTRVSDDIPTAYPVPVKVSDKPPAADTAPVSDKPPVSPTADTASAKVSDKPPVDDDAPMSKPVRSAVTAVTFFVLVFLSFLTIFLIRTLVRLAKIGTPKLRLI